MGSPVSRHLKRWLYVFTNKISTETSLIDERLSVRLRTCLSVYLPVCLPVCLSACLSLAFLHKIIHTDTHIPTHAHDTNTHTHVHTHTGSLKNASVREEVSLGSMKVSQKKKHFRPSPWYKKLKAYRCNMIN